jgi:hypothetical protein
MLGFCVAVPKRPCSLPRFAGFSNRSLISEERLGRGSWTSSYCRRESRQSGREPTTTYLERLCVPVAHSADGRHLIEAIGKVVELLYAVCEPYGELFGKELRRAEEGSCRWLLTKLHHLPERDTYDSIRRGGYVWDEYAHRSLGSCYSATAVLAKLALCDIALRTLIVSMSLSVRLHDMMTIAQRPNGLFTA